MSGRGAALVGSRRVILEALRSAAAPRVLVAACLALALAAAGCGGDSKTDEEKVEEAVTEFANNLDDETKTCESFSTAALEKASGKKGDEAMKLCREQFKDEKAPENFEIRSTKVDGDRATVQVKVDGIDSEVRMVKEDGDWKVSQVS